MPSADVNFTIHEKDEINTPSATYILSTGSSKKDKGREQRIDVAVGHSTTFFNALKPVGFIHYIISYYPQYTQYTHVSVQFSMKDNCLLWMLFRFYVLLHFTQCPYTSTVGIRTDTGHRPRLSTSPSNIPV